jgi:uncharacterized protein involved in outer membrane biogenesis/outer membrane protein OmpA-like peptidoglycan-associated protein
VPEEPKVPGLIIRAPRKRHPVRKILLWSAALVLLYAIVGFFVVPPILKSILTRQLSEQFHRQTTIEEIRMNPFALTCRVRGLSIKDRDGSGPFISFKELYVNLEAASLIKWGPVLREVRLTAPYLMLVRKEDLSYNFSDLLQDFAAKPQPEASAPAKPFRFSVNNIQIEQGTIDFDDRPKQTRHVVSDMAVTIPFISNLPYYIDVFVQPSFQATVNGTPVTLGGKTKPFVDSHETSLDINVSNFQLPKYMEYVPIEMKFKIPSGSLDTQLSLSFIQYRDKAPSLLVQGTIALNKLSVRDLDAAPLLEVPQLAVAVDRVDVFAKKANLRSVVLQSPELYLRRNKSGAVNVLSLIPAGSAPGESSKSEPKDRPQATTPAQIDVAEVRLADGMVAFTDDAIEKSFRTVVKPLNVLISHFSNAPNQSATLEVSLKTDAGEAVSHRGSFSLEPLAADGTIGLDRIRVKRYAPYYAKSLLFDVEDGVVAVSANYQYNQPEHQTTVSGLSFSASSIRLKRRGEKEEFLKVPAFSVKNGAIDLEKRNITLGEITTKKGSLLIRRENDGTINVGKLVPGPKPGELKVTVPVASPAVTKPAPSPAWVLTLKRLAIDQYAVIIEDHIPPEATIFRADPVSITAENISTAKDRKGHASVRITLNKTTQFATAGTIGLEPLSANLSLDLTDLRLTSLQPYFRDRINLVVTDGALSAHGTLTAAGRADKPPVISYAGDVSLLKFATIDKAHSQDFLNWDSLAITGMNAGNEPLHVEIKEVSLTDFYSRLIVNADGTLNVQGLTVSEKKVAENVGTEAAQPVETGPQQEVTPTRIQIETVTLQGGNVSFSDRFIKPNYSAELTQLAGRISGLSSEESQRADVDIRGQLGNGAPLQIVGTTNPLGKDLFVDLRVDFKDIDLSPLTAYSGKYAGYAIEKGKLSLQVKYLIEKRKVNAQNKLFVDQFTFGDKVDSPSATKLPVRLAVSLLKDRNGEIHLDVPVTGSLDDPQFSVWGVIVQVITNLLSKAATAPFTLLASLVGGGPELSYVEFDYGASRVHGSAEEKLQKLGKILYERPAVKLEVVGRTDSEKDAEAILQQQFARKLKAQKLSEIVKKGGPPVALDDIKIEGTEYDKYLALAYKKETFQKPKNLLGFAKDLPAQDMKALILTHIRVTDEDLRQLAMDRAQAVMEYLTQSAKIEPGRMFLVSAESSSQDQKDRKSQARVDFAIK